MAAGASVGTWEKADQVIRDLDYACISYVTQ